MRRLQRMVAAALMGLAACGGDGPGPQAGDIVFGFSGGVPQTGALLIRVTGQVDQVTPIGTYRVASAPIIGATATRVVITGNISPGDVLKLRIPDVSLFETYAVTIEQAASGTDFSLVDPALYTVILRH